MNAQPAREGFVVVEDQPLAPPAVATPATPPGVRRAAPPPEIELSPADKPPTAAGERMADHRHAAAQGDPQQHRRGSEATDVARAARRRHQPLRQSGPRQQRRRDHHRRAQDDVHDRGACQHPAAVHRERWTPATGTAVRIGFAVFFCPNWPPGRRRGRDHPLLLPARQALPRLARSVSCRCPWTRCCCICIAPRRWKPNCDQVTIADDDGTRRAAPDREPGRQRVGWAQQN